MGRRRTGFDFLSCFVCWEGITMWLSIDLGFASTGARKAQPGVCIDHPRGYLWLHSSEFRLCITGWWKITFCVASLLVLFLFAELEHVYSGGAGCDLPRGRGARGGLCCPTSAVLCSSARQWPQPLLRGQLWPALSFILACLLSALIDFYFFIIANFNLLNIFRGYSSCCITM